MKVHLCTNIGELTAYRNEWSRLHQEQLGASPSSSFAWAQAFASHQLKEGQQFIGLVAEDNTAASGLLTLTASRSSTFGRGSLILSTPADLQTYSVDLVCQEGREIDVWNSILSSLKSEYKEFFILRLPRVPEHSAICTVPPEALGGSRVFRDFDGIGSFVRLDGDFDTKIGGLSSNFRKNLKKQSRKLDGEGDPRFVFRAAQESAPSDLDILLDLEYNGWKGKSGGAIKCSEGLVRFYRDLTSNLAADGLIEWHFLYLGERPIAVQMAARTNRRITILKIAYDEEMSHCSPGNMLFLETIKREYEMGLADEIDCLTDMEWHKNWRMEQRKYYNVLIFPKNLFPTLFGYVPEVTKDRIRRLPLLRKLFRMIKATIKR